MTSAGQSSDQTAVHLTATAGLHAAGLSRRSFLVSGLAAALLIACGGDDDPPAEHTSTGNTTSASTSANPGPWEFTDDRGVKVTLPKRPERIAAYDTATAALWHLGVNIIGTFGGPFSASNPNLEGVDLSAMASLGEVYGEVDLEKIAQLRAELIVTAYDPRQTGPVFGFTEQSVADRANALAPIVAINGIEDPLKVIGRFEDLARALGADLNQPRVTASRTRFEQARDNLKAAIAAKPGLRVIAMTGNPTNGLSVARPPASPGLRQLQQLGLDLVNPGGETVDSPAVDFTKYFWERLSLEQAGRYPVDMIMYDSRQGEAGLAALAAVPTWSLLPAVQAGQIVPWRALQAWNYPAYATDFEVLTEKIRSANPDLVR